MTWFKVDDGFYDHPKVAGVSMAARGLWLSAGTYCAKHLTDGVITARQVRVLGGTRAQVQGLVEAGLWDRFEDELGRVSYSFHDWFDMQPSQKQIRDRRAIERERKAKWREKRTTESGDEQGKRENVTAGHKNHVPDVSRGVSRSSRPGPTRPDLINPPPPDGGGPPKGGEPAEPNQPEAKPAGRGARLPEGWLPSKAAVANIRERFPGVTDAALAAEHEKFTDHWRAASGQNACKRDWNAAWRNWCRRAFEKPYGQQAAGPRRGTRPEDWLGQSAPTQPLFADGKTIIDQHEPPF